MWNEIRAAAAALVVGFLAYYGLLVVGVAAIVVAVAVYQLQKLLEAPPMPHMEDEWWGEGNPEQETGAVEEFRVECDQKVLSDLKERLENTRPFPSSIENAGQSYGMNAHLLKQFMDFWKNDYKWEERQPIFNQHKHYKMQIQGLKIHFVRVLPLKRHPRTHIPLMLLHGWPSSFREFWDTIPHFQNHPDLEFELILPSLPGFVYSEATKKAGLGAPQMAVILNTLMVRLGFERYYVQGGDWGAVVAQHMATLYPGHVKGVHSSMPLNISPRAKILLALGEVFPKLVVEDRYRHWMYPAKYSHEETGYMHLQSTKPDSLGFALNDSPSGLAAYCLEKFVTWTKIEGNQHEDGLLKQNWDYNRLIDNFMLYWMTGCITSSMRIYAESFEKQKKDLLLERIPIRVPSGVARFSNDIIFMSDFLLKDKFPNIVHSSNIEGGHFSAFQLSEIFANDVMKFVETVENNVTYN